MGSVAVPTPPKFSPAPSIIMRRKDDNHRVAKKVKRIEQRLADIEQNERSVTTPNLLRRLSDGVVVGDTLDTPREHTLETAKWNNSDGGWRTSTWGQYD